jgi:hypothetical protein
MLAASRRVESVLRQVALEDARYLSRRDIACDLDPLVETRSSVFIESLSRSLVGGWSWDDRGQALTIWAVTRKPGSGQ